MSTPVSEFEEPQGGWLEFSVAATAFSPDYLATKADTRRVLRREATDFFCKKGIKAAFDDWGVELNVNFMGVSFSIESDCISLVDFDIDAETFDDDFPSAELSVHGHSLADFLANLESAEIESRFAQPCRLIADFARRIHTVFTSGLAEAIRSKSAIVWARPRSPLNAFRRILPDQFRHFRIVEAVAGTAEGPAGERLWSVHIQPVGTAPTSKSLPNASAEFDAPSKIQGASNSGAVQECTEWLFRLIQRSPDERTHTKEELADEALSRWGNNLSGRKFTAALAAAKLRANAPAWSRSGPPKRSKNSVRRIK